MTMFNGYIMVDWSAANSRTTGKDSIWVAELMGNVNDVILTNYPTRSCFRKYLKGKMEEATENNKRLLIGFDFPFGYPANAYGKFSFKDCDDWKGLWKLISTNIKDNIKNYANKNNRFYVASDFNKCFPDNKRPFWGHPTGTNHDGQYPYLENNPPQVYDDNFLSEFRIIEKTLGNQHNINPKSVWQLFCGVTVGGQTLMGIPTLQKVKDHKEIDCVIWPFENIDDKTKHVIAEIYPSIWDTQGDHDINDANQVYTVAKNIAYLDETNLLQKFLNAPFDYERDNKINEGDIIKKEGWILGVDETGNPAQCH